jgi:hypothetical protein
MVLIALLLLTGAAQAQQARELGPVPRYEVKRASSPIVIDGKIDEPAWQGAGTFEFQFPWEKQAGPKQKTTARLLWDDRSLYISYDCEDADVVAHFEQRDDPTYRDDAVELFINPVSSQDFYYGMEMNARATLYDYFNAFPRTLIKRMNFSGVQLATNIRGTLNQTGDKDDGWSLEVAIPWSNFDDMVRRLPPEPGSIWTANLNRWDGTEPRRRLSQWSDSGRERPDPHNPARFGQLVFVK